VDQHGAALTNVLTWQDQRSRDPHPSGGGTYTQVLAARIGDGAIRELGNELRPGLPITTLFWLTEQRALPAGATVLTLADYVLAQLCGAAPGVDATNAAAFGACDLTRGNWHLPALAALGLDRLRWPKIDSYAEVVGAYRIGGRDIPCYRPIGDQQCALLGAALAAGELSINIATGSQVSIVRPAPAFGAYQTRPFFDGRWLTTITHIPAGRSLNALVNLLGELAAAHGAVIADPWEYLIRAAEAADDDDLQIDLAFFPGPTGDRGLIGNISEHNLTAGHLFRAAFRRMAETYRTAAARLQADRVAERIVLSGGLAHRIGLLQRLIVGTLALPYRLAPEEDALHGLLALALACSGRSPSATAAAIRR
jgi:sugar (pentulose or hexulose) kinase